MKAYRELADGLSDMVESGRLSESDIPHDYQWLVKQLVEIVGLDPVTSPVLKKFDVPMTRNVTESVWLQVEAEDPQDAIDKAYKIARDVWDLNWQLDDHIGDVYCGHPDSVIEVTQENFKEVKNG
jgi:hypothetical protein